MRKGTQEAERMRKEQMEQKKKKDESKGEDGQIGDEQDKKEKETVFTHQSKADYSNHVDAHGIKFKKPYDKSQSQGDDTFGQKTKQSLDQMFLACTGVNVFNEDDFELIACAFKSQLKEIR